MPTVMRWAAHRLSSGPAENEIENTSLTWVEAATDATTWVWLHNYWSDAYGIERPAFYVKLVDSAGALVASWSMVLDADSTALIDVRSECIRHNIALPFVGQLILSVSNQKLVAGRPVQVFGEYRRDDGEASGVHGQYGLMRNPAAQVLSAMRLESNETRRTALVVTNPYDGPGQPASMRATVTALADDGRSIKARLPAIAPLSTSIVYLDEVFERLPIFLDGRPGHMKLKLPFPSSRVATFVEHSRTQRRMVNHGTIDRVFDQGGGIPAQNNGARPVASCLVLCDDNLDTIFSLANVWGPIPHDYIASLHFFGPDGSSIGIYQREVRRDWFIQLSAKEVLVGLGVAPPRFCHVEISLQPTNPIDEVPAQFDLLVGVQDHGELIGEVQVGSDFFNASVPPGVSWPDIRRTRIFSRVRTGPATTSTLYLAHPVASPLHDDVAQPTITLLSQNGSERSQITVELAPHGCLLADVDTMFPNAEALGGNDGICTLRVRDTQARLYGYHLTRSPGSASLVIDHLVGG